MPDEIQPALTPDEWKALPRDFGGILLASLGATVRRDGDSAARVMALANAALPDADPRKITAHSVWIVRKLIEDAYIDMQHPGAIRFKREAGQLAAQLAALLPPE